MFAGLKAILRQLILHAPRPIQNLVVMLLLLTAAFFSSSILGKYSGAESNPALIYVLAVTTISLLTEGYLYGILAAISGTFLINYYFMYPFSAFSLSFDGYPVAMVTMVAISCVVGALTSRLKLQAQEAVRQEQNTKTLFELNEKLSSEKNAIQLEKDRETIRSNILRAVSHDLRTPLTSISGGASVLLSSEEIMSERDLSVIRNIRDDANDLIAMVENLLSITRIQDVSFHLKLEEELLEEVAGEAVMNIRRRFPDAGITLELTEDLMLLPMDPMLIKQVIINLLENALRHSGSREQIKVRLFLQEGWAVAEVRDKGKGLSHAVNRAIQEGKPLPRAPGDASRGMGIGLSVCQSIVRAHGGYFSAGNDPGGGAIFRFGLPTTGGNSYG